jgi:sec-independent protein translocase protein TatA
MLGRVGLPELIIILLIVILIFGANRLPELGRGVGKSIRNFKDAMHDGGEDGQSKPNS